MELKEKFRRIGRPVWTHPALHRISRGELTRTEMQAFVLQRHILAEGFVSLLETTIRAIDDVHLQDCIAQNLGDETGRGIKTDSHATWRANYLHALGLDPPFTALPLAGTTTYNETLDELISSSNAFKCAGAVLLLERTIPPEFNRIRRGLEKLFPNTFRLQSSDSEIERATKMRARLYLVDHERHDAAAHEPDLRRVLTRFGGSAHESIVRGAELVAAAKVTFYDSVAENLGR